MYINVCQIRRELLCFVTRTHFRFRCGSASVIGGDAWRHRRSTAAVSQEWKDAGGRQEKRERKEEEEIRTGTCWWRGEDEEECWVPRGGERDIKRGDVTVQFRDDDERADTTPPHTARNLTVEMIKFVWFKSITVTWQAILLFIVVVIIHWLTLRTHVVIELTTVCHWACVYSYLMLFTHVVQTDIRSLFLKGREREARSAGGSSGTQWCGGRWTRPE